jgi:phosphatidylserine/phosphatidylglycerophosphate/cardiolipin synthase-like enzyme
MLRRLPCLLAALLAIAPACATDDESADDWADADPGDFDAKADGVSGSSQVVLDLVDGAKDRVFVQMPTLADKTLLTHLKNAAARGVDVRAYAVVPHPGHPATVLAAEQLEAAGIDLCVDRNANLKGFLALADNKLLTGSGSAPKTVTTAADVNKAAAAFAAATAEDTSGAAPALGSDGTALALMPDSHAGPIVALIAGASSSIDLEIYQLQSLAVIGALEDAHHRGVAVRVMLEPKTVGFANYKQLAARLKADGIAVQATPPAFDSSHNVDHAKFMVVDGKELVFGSGNMVRSGLGGNPALEFTNRDFWIRDRRTASVADAKKLFDADWKQTSTTNLHLDSLVLTPDNADASLLALIDGAHTRLYVYNQSLADATLQKHLEDAKHRGVDVHVLLGDQPGFGGASPANQPAIDELTAAGITAGYFTAHYLHGKVIVADTSAFVGSQNFTKGGLVSNRELGEILTSSPIVTALAKAFLADEKSPTP